MGLSKVARYSAAHGGTVRLESREGAGTSVTLRLSIGVSFVHSQREALHARGALTCRRSSGAGSSDQTNQYLQNLFSPFQRQRIEKAAHRVVRSLTPEEVHDRACCVQHRILCRLTLVIRVGHALVPGPSGAPDEMKARHFGDRHFPVLGDLVDLEHGQTRLTHDVGNADMH